MSFSSRNADLAFLSECTRDAECCAVVGLNNTGKSTLLRALCWS